jgi:hypothetical protein
MDPSEFGIHEVKVELEAKAERLRELRRAMELDEGDLAMSLARETGHVASRLDLIAEQLESVGSRWHLVH